MTAALVAADLLVGRAGSSTMAEASALGLPVIVVPYPHAAGHQRANAQELVAAGGALLVPDEELDTDRLVEVTALLEDPAALEAMRAAARRVGRPGAASVTADLLEALATRSPLPAREAVEAASRVAS
jgi:UDP-N-acetylglucosamine--N-acetylmuramyl-(pentapeptide) pyrophosphoryl-undecaprenol N-acetylglucosamine transferase